MKGIQSKLLAPTQHKTHNESILQSHISLRCDICKKHVDQWSAASKAAVEWHKSSGPSGGERKRHTSGLRAHLVPPKTVWKKGKKGCFTPREKSPGRCRHHRAASGTSTVPVIHGATDGIHRQAR